MKNNSAVFPRNSHVQFRNTNNYGIYSGPRMSIQQYSASYAARDVLNRSTK